MPERKSEARWIENRQRWQINVQCEGERRTFTSSTRGKKGKIEAERKADHWLENQLVGENTRCEVMLDRFLAQKKATTSKANYDQLEYYTRVYIKPVIGRKRIGHTTENDLQDVIDGAFSAGLAKKTLSNIRSTVNSFMKYCRKAHTTTLFPEGLEIPKAAKSRQKNIAQPNDIKTLFSQSATKRYNKICEDRYIHAYRLEVIKGLRPGELLGLMWSDINMDNDTLRIRRSLNDDGDITTGKNANAVRSLSIRGLAKAELEAQRELQNAEGVISPYVFADTDAGFTRQKRYRRAWYRYCEYHGISKTTPYELRHTYVSINDEMPDGLKKQSMGHSKNMDTEGVYGHQKIGDMERIAAYNDSALLKIIES